MAGSAAGADRQSRKSGGLHPQGPTQCRTRGLPRVAARRGGTRGKRRRPRQFECRRPTPPRPGAATAAVARQRSGSAGAHQGSTLESGRPSRRRARGPGGQPPPRPPAGFGRATRKAKGAADPGGFEEVRQSTHIEHRVLLPAPAGWIGPGPISVSDRDPDGPRRAAARRRGSGVERGHAQRETP